MPRTRFTQRAVAALTAIGCTAAVAAMELATAGPSDAHAPRTAYVRAAHLSPDTPKVDVYLTAFRGGSTKLWLRGVGYGDVSPYRRMPAGQYAVAMRPAGAARTTPAALSWTVTLHAGDAYTAFAIGKQRSLHGMVVSDASSTPKAGTGYVRVVQAAGQARQLTVRAGGTSVGHGIAFGSVSHYVAVRSGHVELTARAPSDPALHASTTVRVASRSATTVLLLDEQGGGIEARPLLDTAGPPSTPAGPVPAGGGGTARQLVDAPGGATVPAVTIAAGLAGLAALALVATAATRRRRRTAA